MITRKKFLTLGSLGVISLFFPTYVFSNTKAESNPDINALLKSAREFRKTGQQAKAKQIYQQIIAQYPNEIRAYDGMRKVILSQKKKEWEVIVMLKAASLANPNNIEIKQRLYKEYFNAALGNKRIKKAINFNGRLLSDIKQKYESFLQSQPNNKNLQKQSAKIDRLIEWNADSQNPNKNVARKAYKKSQHTNFKKRFDEISTSELESKLVKLNAKPFLKERKQHIRELNNLIVKRYRKEKNNAAALNKAMSYYNTDKNDPLFLKYVRDLAKLQKNYDTLINVETQNHSLKNTFWSALALMDAQLRKAEETNSLPANLQALTSYLEANAFDPQKKFELVTRKIKIDILKNQPENAKNKILEECKGMFGITNAHFIDRMNVLAAAYYKKAGDTDGIKRILNIAIHPESFINNADTLVKSLAYMNLKRSVSKPIHIQNLNKLLNKI